MIAHDAEWTTTLTDLLIVAATFAIVGLFIFGVVVLHLWWMNRR